MNRFLLFDSGCSLCTELASAIELDSAGRLIARGLGEPEMQQLLNQAQPGWRWEPTLLEVDGDRIHAFTGLAMRVRLLTALGPKHAWHTAQLVRRANVPLIGTDITRRWFLQRCGALLAGLAFLGLPRQWTQDEKAKTHNPDPQALGGEEYSGFVLLPDGASLPPSVRPAHRGIPMFCGLGKIPNAPGLTPLSTTYNSIADLAHRVPFSVYTFSPLPDGLQFDSISLIQHATGEIFSVSVNFRGQEAVSKVWQETPSIWIQPDVPQPFPLWSGNPVEPNGPAVVLKQVDFLPSPGIMVATRRGYVFHWMERNALYTLMAEYAPSREEAQKLATSLSRVE